MYLLNILCKIKCRQKSIVGRFCYSSVSQGSKNELDEIINKYSKSRKAARLPKVTLAILYVALYEMKNVEDVADSIAINEAVELAKKYASSNDASYINGVLGAVSRG